MVNDLMIFIPQNPNDFPPSAIGNMVTCGAALAP
jgi:hypothetical protein